MPGRARIAPLSASHEVGAFDCGEPALNEWLRERAARNEGRFGRTYVACVGDVVAGYHSLAAGSVERLGAPGRLRRNAPNHVPVAILARLAVDASHAGRGLGADLLADALARVAAASSLLGIRAVLVHAKNDAALRFYRRHAEFAEFPEGSRTLYLPIETIVAALE